MLLREDPHLPNNLHEVADRIPKRVHLDAREAELLQHAHDDLSIGNSMQERQQVLLPLSSKRAAIEKLHG